MRPRSPSTVKNDEIAPLIAPQSLRISAFSNPTSTREQRVDSAEQCRIEIYQRHFYRTSRSSAPPPAHRQKLKLTFHQLVIGFC